MFSGYNNASSTGIEIYLNPTPAGIEGPRLVAMAFGESVMKKYPHHECPKVDLGILILWYRSNITNMYFCKSSSGLGTYTGKFTGV